MRSAESDDINENISLSLGDFFICACTENVDRICTHYTLLLLKLLHANNENTL